jgi:hypothetical protein
MRDQGEGNEAFRQVLEPGERLLWHSEPGARGLFLAVLPRMLRDLVFLAFVLAGLYFSPLDHTAPRNLLILALLGLFLLYLLFREVREATASKVSHYLITDRRLIVILPRAWKGNRSVLRTSDGRRYDSGGFPILTTFGSAKSGRIRGGRATLTVPVSGYVPVPYQTGASIEGYRTFPLKLIAVADPEAALAALGPSTRA